MAVEKVMVDPGNSGCGSLFHGNGMHDQAGCAVVASCGFVVVQNKKKKKIAAFE